jgi:hypothetical protein
MSAPNYVAWDIDLGEFSQAWRPAQMLRFFARFAVLAPSGHNTQPWRFEFCGEEVLLRSEPSRQLSFSGGIAGEPFTSLGACLETLRMAAQAFGRELTIEMQPSEGVVASVGLGEQVDARTDVAASILSRVSNRCSYSTDPLPAAFVDELDGIDLELVGLELVTDPDTIGFLAEQTAAATLSIMKNAEFRFELSNWVRNNLTSRYDGMPAFVQGMPLPPSLFAKVIIRHTDVSKSQAKKDAGRVRNSAAIGVIFATEPGEKALVQAGRLYARVCVLAQVHGLASSGVGAAAIDPAARSAVGDRFQGAGGGSVVALLRLGRPSKVGRRSPRWPLSSVSADR